MRAVRLGPWDWLALGLTGLQLAASGYVLRRGLEGALPVIFDDQGAVSRWGDRRDIAVLLLGCAILTAIIHLVLNWLGKRQAVDPRVLAILRAVIFVSIALIAALLAAVGLGGFYSSGAQV
jgi:hypothetical protein